MPVLLFEQPFFNHSHIHRITDKDIGASLVLPRHVFPKSHHRYYAFETARSSCTAHGYIVSKSHAKTPSGCRKTYDLFIEVRLRTLYDYVDYFVIVEAPLTFQGGHKNLTIHDNWDRFKAYRDKMIYHLLEFPADFKLLRH